MESGTVSRQAAESEVEDILQGIETVRPPAPYHDILPRYRVYEKAMQSRAFDEAPPPIKQRLISQVVTAEYLIFRKIKMSPAFAQKVMEQHPNFPMFMPGEAPMSPPVMLAQGMPPMLPMPGAPGAPPLGGLPPEAAGPDMPLPPEQPMINPAPPVAEQTIPGPGTIPSPGELP